MRIVKGSIAKSWVSSRCKDISKKIIFPIIWSFLRGWENCQNDWSRLARLRTLINFDGTQKIKDRCLWVEKQHQGTEWRLVLDLVSCLFSIIDDGLPIVKINVRSARQNLGWFYIRERARSEPKPLTVLLWPQYQLELSHASNCWSSGWPTLKPPAVIWSPDRTTLCLASDPST